MAYETILVERNQKLGFIKLHRPKQRNALNMQLCVEILSALRELEDDPEVHVIILMSAVPGVFCAGRDLAELESLQDADVLEQREPFGKIAEIMLAVPSMGKLVIAAVSGHAVAGGCGLVACCDLAVAATDATFSLPETNLGLFPTMVGAAMLRLIGFRKCLELFATGDRIDAREAERLGLVNRVVAPEELEATVAELARKLAGKSQTSLKLGKEALYNMADMEYGKAVKYAREVTAVLASTDDARQRIAAYLARGKK